jgi:hypothetical protein
MHLHLIIALLTLTVTVLPAAQAGTKPKKEATPAAEKPVIGQGLFVGVGYGGRRLWSLDGQNWQEERDNDQNGDDDTNICDLTYGKGIFLCSGGGGGKGFVRMSVDGKTWTETRSAKCRIVNVGFLDGRFFSAGCGGLATSDDGMNWKQGCDFEGSGHKRRWAAGNGVVLFAGNIDGGLSQQQGGKTGWRCSTRDFATHPPIEYVNREPIAIRFLDTAKLFVSVQNDATVEVSSDAVTWRKVGVYGTRAEGKSLRIRDNILYLWTDDGIRTSSDGVTWTKVEGVNPGDFPRAEGNGVFLRNPNGGLQVSPDGKSNWQKPSGLRDGPMVNAVIYGIPFANLPPEVPAKKKKK